MNVGTGYIKDDDDDEIKEPKENELLLSLTYKRHITTFFFHYTTNFFFLLEVFTYFNPIKIDMQSDASERRKKLRYAKN